MTWHTSANIQEYKQVQRRTILVTLLRRNDSNWEKKGAVGAGLHALGVTVCTMLAADTNSKERAGNWKTAFCNACYSDKHPKQ